jgi:hypothetical protein
MAASASPETRGREVARYPYTDEEGDLLFEVVRFEPKAFAQRRPDGRGGFVWGLDGVRRVPYRLKELLSTVGPVYITEGEKDADRLAGLGLTSTCNAGGAGKWPNEFSRYFEGRDVVILADNDGRGLEHAGQVARSLQYVAKSVRVVWLPGLLEKGDVSDWLDAGHTIEELESMVAGWPFTEGEGETLLFDLYVLIRRYVSLSEAQAVVAALWAAHTHTMEAAEATPYLAISSSEKGSGKTLLLEVLELVVAKPWLTGRVSAAVLIRKVDKERPTLLLDESDAAFSGEKDYAEALRGVLNTGHRRGGKASLCVGQGANISFKDFSTFCAKAIAGIGKLPDTVADRSIPIQLKRARKEEVLARFRRREAEQEATPIRRHLEAWAEVVVTTLAEARPSLPDCLTGRQQDAVEPLLAIADLVGGNWPERARRAILEIFSDGQAEDDSTGVRLLADIKAVFDERKSDRIPSADLVEALAKIETSPWGDWHGKPLTPAKLAKLLQPKGIAPIAMRVSPTSTPRGYQREDFEDAWSRYLPPLRRQSATVQQTNAGAASSDFSECNKEPGVAPSLVREAAKNGRSCTVALSEGGTWGENSDQAEAEARR